jgi:3-oxoacyl-[acyl-carrier-protein] synthase II
MIRTGRAEVMLSGGADAFSRITYMGFSRLGAIAPERCQPFDRNRRGMIPGEGACVVVLEPLDAARRRGARIYAELVGYGLTCDSHHMTAAHPEGDGAVRAMRMALAESGLAPEEVSYISAHGTGTPTNDRVETLAVERVFGRGTRTPISSIKSMIGHTMGAASAFGAIICCQALRQGFLPPTANVTTVDPDLGPGIDVVPGVARPATPRIVQNQGLAFGGNNVVTVLGRVA